MFFGRQPLEDVSSLDRIYENPIAIVKDGRFVKRKIEDVRVEISCGWNK